MKSSFLPALFMAVMLPCTFISVANDKPVKASSPLGADEVFIYNAVLRHYGDKDTALNVSQTTYPLDPSSPMDGLQDAECFERHSSGKPRGRVAFIPRAASRRFAWQEDEARRSAEANQNRSLERSEQDNSQGKAGPGCSGECILYCPLFDV
jgi:hypothetical protein